MSPEHRYLAHGLLVVSEIGLPLPPSRCTPADPDVVLRRGADRPVPAEGAPGEVLAALDSADGEALYRFTRDGVTTVLRYPGLCEFVGDHDLSGIAVHLHPGADPGIVAVLASGALLAAHLKLREELVLHASSVAVGGRALAFVGASGMGKSTLAAALCGCGCDLVSDDVLRVGLTDPAAVRVFPGSTANRLRANARGLAESAPPGAARPTADGRLALLAPSRAADPLPLLGCVVPFPSREAHDVSAHRLPAGRALMRLAQFPRIVGWQDPRSSAREFQALADLVERVPVFEALIPWGPPFAPGVLAGLLDVVLGADRSQR